MRRHGAWRRVFRVFVTQNEGSFRDPYADAESTDILEVCFRWEKYP